MELSIIKGIFEIHCVMDLLDDGYHNVEICQLVKISNKLMARLSPSMQKMVQRYFTNTQPEEP